MDKKNISHNAEDTKNVLSPQVRKYLTAFSLSAGLLLGGNGGYKNEAQAQMGISPTPQNLITSPVYASVPGNVYHGVLYSEDASKFNKTKEELETLSIKIIQQSNILSQIPNLKLYSDAIIGYFIQINNVKTPIESTSFMIEFIKIGEYYGLSQSQSLEIFELYTKNNLIPDIIKTNVILDLKREYTPEELNNKLSQVKEIQEVKGKITIEEFKEIFKEYIEKKQNQNEMMLMILMFAILTPIIGIGGTFGYIMITENKKTGK